MTTMSRIGAVVIDAELMVMHPGVKKEMVMGYVATRLTNAKQHSVICSESKQMLTNSNREVMLLS